MTFPNPKSQSQNPWTSLHARVHRVLRSRQLLPAKKRVLAAVSGGQDSLCLLKLLLDLQPKWGWDLAVGHCDHRWQYDTGIAEHVEAIARHWQLPFYLQVAEEVTNSEGAARQWRYQALTAIAQAGNFAYVVTAHTQSDRAETLIYNLMRGAGADGLQSLTWQRQLAPGVQLTRPLLEVRRAETGQFCQDFQLPVWEDIYNQDFKYARNRIRQELLPYLKDRFNPQVETTLAQTAELLRADVEYLEQQACQLWQQALWDGTADLDLLEAALPLNQPAIGHFAIINRRLLLAAPLALQRRAARQFLQQFLPSAPTFSHIESIITLLAAPNRSRSDSLPGGILAEVRDVWLFFHLAK